MIDNGITTVSRAMIYENRTAIGRTLKKSTVKHFTRLLGYNEIRTHPTSEVAAITGLFTAGTWGIHNSVTAKALASRKIVGLTICRAGELPSEKELPRSVRHCHVTAAISNQLRSITDFLIFDFVIATRIFDGAKSDIARLIT